MKKIALLFFIFFFQSTTVLANENRIVVDPLKSPNFSITKHWKLNTWHDKRGMKLSFAFLGWE